MKERAENDNGRH